MSDEIEKLRKQLSDPRFLENAPSDTVAKARARLAKLAAKSTESDEVPLWHCKCIDPYCHDRWDKLKLTLKRPSLFGWVDKGSLISESGLFPTFTLGGKEFYLVRVNTAKQLNDVVTKLDNALDREVTKLHTMRSKEQA